MQGKKFNRIFFFDVHMALLAGSWCFFSPFLRPQRLSMIYLMGPERIKRSKLVAWLTIRLLQRKNVILYLRTEELVDAWHQTFPTVPAANIRYLPSLELPDISEPLTKPADNEVLKFGILGQIRQGKGLEWLVPLFLQDAELGKLSVAGAFNNGAEAKILGFLNDFDGFKNGFLSDEEMLAIARQQHYLLMLYDNWDARMESAVLYLAARANRPVIAYGKGWCGRQIRQYQNGLIAPENQAEIAEFVKAVPKPGSQGYDDLLAGVARFRRAHSPEALRERYLNELMN
jgi:glycosyltransferase involved in cell wall biosynthesis